MRMQSRDGSKNDPKSNSTHQSQTSVKQIKRPVSQVKERPSSKTKKDLTDSLVKHDKDKTDKKTQLRNNLINKGVVFEADLNQNQ